MTTVVVLAVVAMLAVALWPTEGESSTRGEAVGSTVVAEPSPSAGAAPDPAQTEGDPAATEDAGPAAEPPSSATRTEAAGDDTSSVDTDAALRRDLQRLLDARAEAWEAVDPALLVDVLAPGSVAEASDQALLREATTMGVTYSAVDFELARMEVLESGDDEMVVRAVVERSALTVSDGEKVVLESPARRDVVQVELVRAEGAWLLAAWDEGAG